MKRVTAYVKTVEEKWSRKALLLTAISMSYKYFRVNFAIYLQFNFWIFPPSVTGFGSKSWKLLHNKSLCQASI